MSAPKKVWYSVLIKFDTLPEATDFANGAVIDGIDDKRITVDSSEWTDGEPSELEGEDL